MSDGARVLSVQSWVCHGFVGNRIASLALQVLGHDCDAVNTVTLANHTGYGKAPGHVASPTELNEIFQGLKANGLFGVGANDPSPIPFPPRPYTHLLTGYVRSADCVLELGRLVQELKQMHPSLVYVCDPVLGDNGKLYVPEDNIQAVRQSLVPLADCLFPNALEAELLAGQPVGYIDSEEHAFQVIDQLHGLGPKTVVITSVQFAADKDRAIYLFGSSLASGEGNGRRQRFKGCVPRLKANFSGTGDLMSSLLLAWLWKQPDAAMDAVKKALVSVHHVMRHTLTTLNDPARTLSAQPPPELHMVQCLDQIREPPLSECTAFDIDLVDLS